MSTKFRISQNTTFTPPMVYPSAWWREQKAGGKRKLNASK
jgi:hypothetical protein